MTFRGQQALPNYKRTYTCEICGKPQVQLGPGRGRRACREKVCQRKQRSRREMPRAMFGAECNPVSEIRSWGGRR